MAERGHVGNKQGYGMGQAVEKSLFTPASVGVLSEPAGIAKERYLCARRLCAIWSKANCARVSKKQAMYF